MLELSTEANANASHAKNEEAAKRKKAKLLKKLKEQEGLVNANKQVMVRDRRRPRKNIKEMSVLNKRRRVIKNTARKEIAQQRATLESMRHIEMKRHSLEARELELFVERIRKVKENKRLSMLFAKFQFISESEGESEGYDPGDDSADLATVHSSSTLGPGDKNMKTESMNRLIDELNSMSLIIDYDSNPQWKFIMGGRDRAEEQRREEETESEPETTVSGRSAFGVRRFGGGAVEAPAALQSVSERLLPNIDNTKAMTAKDDFRVSYRDSLRRCSSQPNGVAKDNREPINRYSSEQQLNTGALSTIPDEARGIKDGPPPSANGPKKAPYHSNWREREKRGEALYSPVALSPIQSGLFSPDFVMEEDELTANYRKQINPNRFKKMAEEMGGSGDMEFRQAMGKIPAEKKKKVGYSGKQSVIEMQLATKTRSIAEKVAKVREETMMTSAARKAKGTKGIAQLIHKSGEGDRFVEEVRALRRFAALCNCKYLRTDPDRLQERKEAYMEELMGNVTRRIEIRKRWKAGMSKMNIFSGAASLNLPIITQATVE